MRLTDMDGLYINKSQLIHAYEKLMSVLQ